MADKSISQLTEAERVYTSDLFVLQQSGAAKSLSGNTLKNWLLEIADSLGGIASIQKVGTSGLVDTYRITYAKSTETTDFTVTNGAKGDKGDNMYIWIRYTGSQPTANSHAMSTTPDNWIGIYYGTASTAPTDWTKYQWFEIKGEKGDTGDPATLTGIYISYKEGDSGTDVPLGEWSTEIPSVAQGKYLWTHVMISFNTGNSVSYYSVARMGLDGTGAVSKVCNKEPDSNGNVTLTAANVGALPLAGGTMSGTIGMAQNKIIGLKAPEATNDAANKGYVDSALTNAKTVTKTATLTVAGWTGSAPYVQSVTIIGLTDAKKAMAYPVYGSDTSTNIALKEACGMVSFASRSGGVMTFTCLEDKPTVAIPITVEVYV